MGVCGAGRAWAGFYRIEYGGCAVAGWGRFKRSTTAELWQLPWLIFLEERCCRALRVNEEEGFVHWYLTHRFCTVNSLNSVTQKATSKPEGNFSQKVDCHHPVKYSLFYISMHLLFYWTFNNCCLCKCILRHNFSLLDKSYCPWPGVKDSLGRLHRVVYTLSASMLHHCTARAIPPILINFIPSS